MRSAPRWWRARPRREARSGDAAGGDAGVGVPAQYATERSLGPTTRAMRTELLRLAAAIVSLPIVVVASAACSAAQGEEEASAMRIDKVCIETACDAKHKRDSEACSRCMNACFGASFDCDSRQACKVSCSSTSCRDEERATCEEEGFRAELGERIDDEVEVACVRLFDHLDSCQVTLRGVDALACQTWAKTHRSEVAGVYDCIVEAGCTGDVSACELAPTTLGDDVCDGIASTCGEEKCSSETREALNGLGGVLRDDVAAAARYCASRDGCGDAMECFNAWVDATQP